MPKPKPTEIIRHEIVLGRREFELVENALIYPSIVAGVRDALPFVKDAATAIALVEGIATVLELMGIDTPIPTPVDLYNWFIENGFTYNEVKKQWEKGEYVWGWATGGAIAGQNIAGPQMQEDLEEYAGIDPCDLPLPARLAVSGFAPTQLNLILAGLGLLPGMPDCG
tara:strand:+ start:585 stop:1088 length:504 start_codon:yes stop_codon:yes gene_type:complete